MVSIEIPEEIYRVLLEAARRKGKTVEQLIVDSVVNELDRESRIQVYRRLYEKYLRDAEELYRKGDYAQACEKYWGAVAALLSIVGEKEGLPHYTHRDLRDIAEHLTEKTGDPEYSKLFSSAEALHANFYHSFMTKLSLEAHRKDVTRLIQKLKALTQKGSGSKSIQLRP